MPSHGAEHVAGVRIVTYNAELRDAEGFVGDRASKRAFTTILEDWRERLRAAGADPLGDTPTAEIDKRTLDRVLVDGDAEAAGLVQGAVEEFAQELAAVTRRFLMLREWRGATCIVVGGGLRASRVGELAIGRASVLLRAAPDQGVELRPIRHHPDEAGLIGGMHLAPRALLDGADCAAAVDIGGTNMRAGMVELRLGTAKDLSAAHVMAAEQWRHHDDQPTRDEAVDRLCAMLERLTGEAARMHRVAPLVSIGCPGLIDDEGTIVRGGQNLPGNWEADGFNLPAIVGRRLPPIDGRAVTVLMHNDAVAQGLSELPWMRGVAEWGAFTIGTGLGNARFSTGEGGGGAVR